MQSLTVRGTVAALVAGMAMLLLVTTANASHVAATVTVPPELVVGQVADIEIALRDDGRPVSNTLVMLYTDASFADISGDIVVASGMTDENGIALIEYEPRHASIHELRVEYTAPGDSEPVAATTAVSVSGAAQLHQSASGIAVPGLNVWLIIAVVSGVWFLLASVGWRVFAIAQAGSEARA